VHTSTETVPKIDLKLPFWEKPPFSQKFSKFGFDTIHLETRIHLFVPSLKISKWEVAK